ncbi:MAG: hypothetical protein H7Z10_06185, partial [Gemmatimonadaceae bacterium]|nr:hypothetical protein [Acetobacteraceae bacterium]
MLTTPAADTPAARAAVCRLGHSQSSADVATAARLGYSHVLLPAMRLDMAPLLAAARTSGLAVLVDVVVDTISATILHDPAPTLFVTARAATLDPRHDPADADSALATLGDAADAERLADWWAPRIAALGASGVAGVRLLGLDALPSFAVAPFLIRIRAGCPGMTLFAWTPGVAWGSLRQLPSGTVDLVASSLPWWDGQADWLWQELDILRRIAPVVVPQEGRAAALAPWLADGWMADLADGDNTLPALPAGVARPLTGPGQHVMALLRTDAADPRQAAGATVVVANMDMDAPASVDPAQVFAGAGSFGPWRPDGDGDAPDPAAPLVVAPGAVLTFTAP